MLIQTSFKFLSINIDIPHTQITLIRRYLEIFTVRNNLRVGCEKNISVWQNFYTLKIINSSTQIFSVPIRLFHIRLIEGPSYRTLYSEDKTKMENTN